MCCVVFRGPVLYKQKIIYHRTTNKTNIWLCAIPQVVQSIMCPPVLWMSKPGNSMTALLWIFQTLYLWLYKAAERGGGGVQRGWGPGMINTLSVRFVHVFSLLSILQKKNLKCSSGLQLLSISNRSKKQQYVFYFSLLCSMFFMSFLCQHWMVIWARLWHDDCYRQSDQVIFYDWNDISAQNELSQMMQELSSVWSYAYGGHATDSVR